MCMYITTCMCVHAGSVTVSLIKAKPANDNTCTYNGTIPIIDNIEFIPSIFPYFYLFS